MYKILGSYSSTSLTSSVFFPLEMTITEHGVPVFTPRSKVQPPVLNKPIKTSKSIVKTERFIQYGHFGKGTERFSDIQFSHVPLSTLPESRVEQQLLQKSVRDFLFPVLGAPQWNNTQRHSAGLIQAKSLDGQSGNCSFEKELTVNLWVNTTSAVPRTLEQFHPACSK